MNKAFGFTLLEIAVVLAIVALMLGGLLVPFSAQMDLAKVSDTQKTLDSISEAIIGFALINGRLPCPATPTSSGMESPVGGGVCSNPYNGFVPAVTLGFATVDSQGFAVDAWNNRVRYAVTTANSSAFTTLNGMKTAGMGALSPDLSVCASAAGISGTSCGTAVALTRTAPAIIYSLGKNGAMGGIGADEAENPDNDRVFVSHSPNPAAAANGEFDDIFTWISPNILLNRMVQAGVLP